MRAGGMVGADGDLVVAGLGAPAGDAAVGLVLVASPASADVPNGQDALARSAGVMLAPADVPLSMRVGSQYGFSALEGIASTPDLCMRNARLVSGSPTPTSYSAGVDGGERSKRRAAQDVYEYGSLAAAAAVTVVWVALQADLGAARIALIALGGLLEYTFIAMFPVVAEQAPEARATMFSIVSLGASIGLALGSPVAIYLFQSVGLIGVGGSMLIALIAALMLTRFQLID